MKRLLKSLIVYMALVLVLPLIVLARLGMVLRSEELFRMCGHLLSMIPGILGSYIRVGYYKGTLTRISSHVYIDFGSFFSHPEAQVGEYVSIGAYTIIGKVVLEDEVLVSSRCSILSTKYQHVEYTQVPTMLRQAGAKQIRIGRHSWIGENCVVMASLGENCVVSSGSVVTRDMPAGTMAVGNPARPVPQSVVQKRTAEQLPAVGDAEQGVPAPSPAAGGSAQDRQSRHLRIAFMIDMIEDETGGTEHQILLILRNLDRSRFEPHLICTRRSPWQKDPDDDFEVHTFPCPSFYQPGTYFNVAALARFLRRRQFDIVQMHFRDATIAGTIAARLAGVGAIVSTRRGTPYWHNALELSVLRTFNRFAQAFLVNSNSLREKLQSEEHVPAEKIHVVYNGYEAKFHDGFSGERDCECMAKDLGLAKDSAKIIGVANLRRVKRIDLLVSAAALLQQQSVDSEFLVAGVGDEKKSLQAQIDSLGNPSAFHLLGYRPDIHRILPCCDIGVLCSDSEGLSNAIIEYMACGLPVVATAVGGNNELVQDGVNGFTVPAGDAGALAHAIRKLCEDEPRRREMGRQSLRRVAELCSLDKMVDRMQRFYLNLGGQNLRRASGRRFSS